jgi:RNA polymerase sigma factor (sigma-70 family)
MAGKAPQTPLSEAYLADLVVRARSGDAAALNELCKGCYSIVRDFLNYLIPEQAEDLTQEVFASLSRRLAGYEESGRFIPWLQSVAFNLFRTQNRALKRRGEDPFPTQFDIELAQETTTIFTTEKRALHRAVEELPPTLRNAWELYAQGFEPRDIAKQLEITPGAAATRVSRAKAELERRLSPQVNDRSQQNSNS